MICSSAAASRSFNRSLLIGLPTSLAATPNTLAACGVKRRMFSSGPTITMGKLTLLSRLFKSLLSRFNWSLRCCISSLTVCNSSLADSNSSFEVCSSSFVL